jgi:hypothetical protein
VFFLFSFIKINNGIVKGTVTPSDGALRAFLFSATDTLNATVEQGIFQINDVKPGNYILMVEGKPPYRNSTKDGISVIDGQLTDVGEITMHQ